MTHHRLTGLAAALALALTLSACSTRDNINNTATKTDTDYTRGQTSMKDMAQGKPVQEIHTQWINPVPVNSQTASTLPGCSLTLTRPGNVSLNEVMAFITRHCHIPVSATPDALSALTGTAGGPTEKLTTVPLPVSGSSRPSVREPPVREK